MITRLPTIAVFFLLSSAWLSNVAAREWTDPTGKYRVEAELIDFTDGVVRLRKEDGRVIAVPLEKLSLADRHFVAQKSTQKDSGIPELLEPQPRAVLDNGRRDRSDTCTWEFKWGEVEGAEGYELFVLGPGARVPLVNRVVDKPFCRSTSRCYVIERNRRGWTWKVRAIRDGQPLPWSKTRTFDVEPLDTDPPKQKQAKAANANQKDTLEGLWRVIAIAGYDAAPDKDALRDFSLLFHVEGDKATLLCGPIDEKGIKKWTVKVFPDQAPKRFELTREGPPLPEKYARLPDTLRGTYEFVDDVLRIGLLKEAFLGGVEGDKVQIELERVDAKQVETLMALQGPWKQTTRVAFGSPEQKETIVWVEGEWVVPERPRRKESMAWCFRLRRTIVPEGIPAPDALGWPETTWGDCHEITFAYAGGRHEGVDGFLVRTADGRTVVGFGLCYFLLERATTEDLAAAELKRVMSTTWLLAQKKLSLQKFVAKYAATQAAAEARQELERMPSDEEICELDAAKYLKHAQGFFDRQDRLRAKQHLQLIIDQYPDTEAAKKAKVEIEAATCLEKALEIRVGDQALGDQRLKVVVRDYPGTNAASEAERVLDQAVQREKEAAELLRLAKMLLPDNPQAAKRRLEELVKGFAGTKAAEEARRLLEETR